MKLLEQTCQNAVRDFLPPAPSLADHNLTEECRQFPYRIALGANLSRSEQRVAGCCEIFLLVSLTIVIEFDQAR